MACDSINKLPNELLVKIFSKLNVRDALLCCRVCKEWDELLNSGDGVGSVIRISSVKIVSFGVRRTGKYRINVGTVEGPLIEFWRYDGASVRRTIEKLGHLCGQWLNSFGCVFSMDLDGFSSSFFLPEDNISTLIDYMRSVLSFVAAVFERGAQLKGVEINLWSLWPSKESPHDNEVSALEQICWELTGQLMAAQSVEWASVELWRKVDLSEMNWWHGPPPLTELTLGYFGTDKCDPFQLLHSLRGSLERLYLHFKISAEDVAEKHGELVLPKLSHLNIMEFREHSTSLLKLLGFLSPNLEMLKILTLRVRHENPAPNDGEQNEPGFSYVDLVHYCTKLRHLNVETVLYEGTVEQRVDPPLQLQAGTGRPTLEIVDWTRRHLLIDMNVVELRPDARIQGTNVKLIDPERNEQGQFYERQGPIFATDHLSVSAVLCSGVLGAGLDEKIGKESVNMFVEVRDVLLWNRLSRMKKRGDKHSQSDRRKIKPYSECQFRAVQIVFVVVVRSLMLRIPGSADHKNA